MSGKIKCFFQIMPQAKCASLALLLLRLVAGTAFMFHGWGKIQSPLSWMPPDSPVPGFLQFLAALAEFGGGLAWVFGALTSLASVGLIFTMIVATALHAVVMGDPFVASGPGMGSYELALLYLVISILFLIMGPGKYSVDQKLFGERV